MNSYLTFAEFLDRCCQRYVKQPSYRRTLDRERPDYRPIKTRRSR